jgi:DNA-binding MarR family transcriptional regulator
VSQDFRREDSLGWLVAVLHQEMAQQLDERLKTFGLSIGLWPTLMCLWEGDGITQKEIAERVRVQTSTTTRALDRLQAMGLVERQQDPDSRRAWKVVLTPAGWALKEPVAELPLAVNSRILQRLPEADQVQLMLLMKRLLAK